MYMKMCTCVPVYGSNPGTGEHGGSQEGRGRHVEGHSVSFLHPLPLEHISDLTGHLQQLSGVGMWKVVTNSTIGSGSKNNW